MSLVNPDSSLSLPVVSRRQRVRQATKDDLVAASRELLVEQGLSALTVRAVAARLGMTAPALYRYYDSREALLEEVVDQLYDELAGVLEQARESARDGTVTDRFLVTARAFRSWALDHRAEFGLLFGAPVPGLEPKGHDLVAEGLDGRGVRFMLVWLQLFLEIPAAGVELPAWPRPIPASLQSQLTSYLDSLLEAGVPLPPRTEGGVDLAMLFLTSWQELYGFICTEVFGHLAFAIQDGTAMFEDRLVQFCDQLHLP